MTDKIAKAYEHLRSVAETNARSAAGTSDDRDARPASRVVNVSDLKDHTSSTRAIVEIDFDVLTQQGLLVPGSVELVKRQFRRIKRPIINNAFDLGIPRGGNANVVMITSALPAAGKTFVSTNLALSIAKERDLGAVLVDADVLKPRLSNSLGMQAHVGLTDFLDRYEYSLGDVVIPTTVERLSFVSAGASNPDATELLGSARMKEFVDQISSEYSDRIVLFDTPPLLLTSEAQVLAEHVGQIIMVVNEGETTQSSLLEAVELLDRDKPINAVLNRSSSRHSRYDAQYYGYTDTSV